MDTHLLSAGADMQWLGLLLVLIASTLGMAFSLRRFTAARIGILVGISLLLAGTGEHSLLAHPTLIGWLSLGVGAGFGVAFPCTGSAPVARTTTLLRAVLFAIVVGHGALEGHVLRELHGTALLLLLLFLHKLLDGADARLLFDRAGPSVRWLVGFATVGATPLGYFLIPESSANATLHRLLFAGIIGFNLGSALHLFRERYPAVPTVTTAIAPDQP